MDEPEGPDRLLRKLRQLGETLEEIDEWIRAGREGRPQGHAAVDDLLRSVLYGRVSLESLQSRVGAPG